MMILIAFFALCLCQSLFLHSLLVCFPTAPSCHLAIHFLNLSVHLPSFLVLVCMFLSHSHPFSAVTMSSHTSRDKGPKCSQSRTHTLYPRASTNTRHQFSVYSRVGNRPAPSKYYLLLQPWGMRVWQQLGCVWICVHLCVCVRKSIWHIQTSLKEKQKNRIVVTEILSNMSHSTVSSSVTIT